MLAHVVGIRRNVHFDIDGRSYDGTHIFVTHLENGVEGCMAEKYFLNSATFDTSWIKVDDDIDIQFNRRGKIATFNKWDKK